ncbi:hypothetical protein DET59_1201, partial [Rossellomorea aquimaris]
TLFLPAMLIDLRVIYLTITLKYHTTSILTEGGYLNAEKHLEYHLV